MSRISPRHRVAVNVVSVFISYSHRDKRWRDLLKAHLCGALASEDVLEVWSDQMIGTGEDWYARITEAIGRTSVAILLVSADFLASQFICKEEIPRLLLRRQQEGLRVFPLICRPCLWEGVPWLSSMRVRPEGGRALSERTLPQAEVELARLVAEVYRADRREIPLSRR